jgi:hypothetical protein
MKRFLLLVFFLPFCLTDQEDFKWQTDIDAARKLAEKDGKPLLVIFR